MNKKDEALRTTAKGMLIIANGGFLTPKEAKMFADLCCLALPIKYRFTREELDGIRAGVQLRLSELGEPS